MKFTHYAIHCIIQFFLFLLSYLILPFILPNFENYHKQIGFSKQNSSMKNKKTTEKKDLQLFSIKLMEKITDPCNVKEHYQLFIRKKNTKSIKQ